MPPPSAESHRKIRQHDDDMAEIYVTLTRMERKADSFRARVNDRFDRLASRVQGVDAQLGGTLGELDARLTDELSGVTTHLDRIDTDLTDMGTHLVNLDDRVTGLATRVPGPHTWVANLDARFSTHLAGVTNHLDRIDTDLVGMGVHLAGIDTRLARMDTSFAEVLRRRPAPS